MALAKQKITPMLWFDNQAEAAAKFYVSVFKSGEMGIVSRYGEAGKEMHGREPGTAMVATFEIEGQKFVALNGGPQFKFSEAVSFVIECENQAEVDYYWDKLTAGGGQESMCGWLKDKFGLSWQVVPSVLPKLMTDPDRARAGRTMGAMMKMKKLDIATLEAAAAGH